MVEDLITLAFAEVFLDKLINPLVAGITPRGYWLIRDADGFELRIYSWGKLVEFDDLSLDAQDEIIDELDYEEDEDLWIIDGLSEPCYIYDSEFDDYEETYGTIYWASKDFYKKPTYVNY